MKHVYIHRDIEPLLRKAVGGFPAVIITGPRQSGKSTLLRKLFSKSHRYFTFDDPLTRERALSDPRYFLEQAGEHMIIDEIQYVPQLLSYIKILIDEKRQKRGRFIFTGSQQFPIMKSLGDSLAGRIAILELLPFSVIEKKRAFRGKKVFSSMKTYYSHACLRGSFPEITLQKEVSPEIWYSGYLQTYLERDVRGLSNIGDLNDFQRCVRLLAARCSQILNLSSLAADLGISVNTVKRWISLLEASRMVYLLYPYYQNAGKRIIKSPKVYFLDTGLVCYLLSLQRERDIFQGPLAGALFENFCFQETLKILFHAGRHDGVYYLRTHNGLEIDLLIERNGMLYPLEWKLSQTPSSLSVRIFERFQDIFSKLSFQSGRIICLRDENLPLSRMCAIERFDEYLQWLVGK